MGDDKNSNNLYYYNDIYEECCLVKDFIKNEYTEKRQIIQDITSTIDTVFVIYADAEEDSEYDIGWRTGYRMTGFHICAIPYGYGHEDENGLAKEIIYFDDTKKGSGGKIETEGSSAAEGMLIPDSDSKKLTEDDLKGLSKEDLRIARNEIYARHGRKFADKELQDHFNQKEWYSPKYDASEFSDSMLNEYEIYNLDLIGKYEKKK